MRPEEEPARRLEDAAEIRAALRALAKRLKFTVCEDETGEGPLLWKKSGRHCCVFHVQVSALVGDLLRGDEYPPALSLLVLPGGRAGLLAYKLERDPALRQAWGRGWRALKFRQVRRLVALPELTHERWEQQLTADSILQPEQMRLL